MRDRGNPRRSRPSRDQTLLQRDLFKKAGLKSRLEIVESTDIKKAIVSFVKKNSCDVIVTGTIPRKGLLGFFSESISDYIVKNAPCTVVLVRKAGQSA